MPHRNVLTSRGSPLIKFQSADRIKKVALLGFGMEIMIM